MAKVLVLKEGQKALFSDGVQVGIWQKDGRDTLNNTLKYLDIETLKKASKQLEKIKETDEYKNAITSNEKKAFLRKMISELQVDNEVKNAMFLISSRNKKDILVPKCDVYKVLIKSFGKKVKINVVKSVVTCLGNETTDDILFSCETEYDFFTDDDFVNCKQSDNVIPILKSFMIDKKEFGTLEAVEKTEINTSELLEKYKLDITTKLLEYFSSSTIKKYIK